MHTWILTVALGLAVGCSSARKEPEAAPPPAPAPAPEAAATPSAGEITSALHNKAEETADKAVAAAAPQAKPAKHEFGGVEPSKSLGWLKNGNKRFMKGHLRKDGQSRKDIDRVAKGQSPHAIVLSCSDSRVPPEVVFDQKLGEIFVVRTAGEALDNMAIGSIEYAVEHLGARLILVMGHSSCGAVNAAIKTLNGGDAGSPALNAMVADIQPRVRDLAANASPDGFAQSFANAKGVAGDLVKRSAILQKAVESGKVTITSSLYNLDSGEVVFE